LHEHDAYGASAQCGACLLCRAEWQSCWKHASCARWQHRPMCSCRIRGSASSVRSLLALGIDERHLCVRRNPLQPWSGAWIAGALQAAILALQAHVSCSIDSSSAQEPVFNVVEICVSNREGRASNTAQIVMELAVDAI